MRALTTPLLFLFLAACSDAPAADPYVSEIYSDTARWLCHPDQAEADNHCATNLDNSAIAADATVTLEPHVANSGAPVDCFYVYPTTSSDSTDYADFEVDAEEPFIVINQAARLSSVCRVFAPVYRQLTVAGLFAGASDPAALDWAPAYADVLDAFKHYIENDSDGRGFILVGHSQGSRHLKQVMQDEIELSPDLSDRMIASYLIGGTVEVPAGEDVGGDFTSIPLCRSEDQIGCIVTYATYRSNEPPESASSIFGETADAATHAGCTHPGALSGGPAALRGNYPVEVDGLFESFVGSDGPFADPTMHDPLTTPFFSLPGLLSGECVDRDGHQYLEVTVNADQADPRVDDIKGDLSEGWGLHLVDVHLMMSDIVSLAEKQRDAWLAR